MEGIETAREVEISVGASLDINITSAFPIILGKGGFSDTGNYKDLERSFLGGLCSQSRGTTLPSSSSCRAG
jgi:hypothetical protein